MRTDLTSAQIIPEIITENGVKRSTRIGWGDLYRSLKVVGT